MAKKSFFQNLSKGIIGKINSFSVNPYNKINLNWFKIKYYKHLPVGKIRRHHLFGRPLYFTDAVQLVYGLKEIFVEEPYRQQLQGAPYIIDCGANIGLSVIYLKRSYPSAEIIAFEPDDTNFHLLTENVKSFGCDHVTLLKEAVWIENTTLQFSSEGSMTSKIEKGNAAGTIAVKAVRLKDLLIREVDFLKIDIEGAEYSVLKDIEDKLHWVQNMFVEYHGTFSQNAELTELIGLINRSGFNFYIKEAASLYDFPFYRIKKTALNYDVQLNLFCFRV